jgi:hypothetical protein
MSSEPLHAAAAVAAWAGPGLDAVENGNESALLHEVGSLIFIETCLQIQTSVIDFINLPVLSTSGAHPASYPAGTGGSSLRVKRPKCVGDHLSPSSPESRMLELYLHSSMSSWRDA